MSILSKSGYRVLCSVIDWGSIGQESVFTDYLTDCSGRSLTGVKQATTRSIRNIISGCGHFKIGKTGAYNQRASQYVGYSKMYLLCKSRNRSVIEVLEAYYNKMFYAVSGNDNERLGSAGIMTNKHRVYYLYIVTD